MSLTRVTSVHVTQPGRQVHKAERFMFGLLNGPHLPAGAAVIEMLTRATRTRGGGSNRNTVVKRRWEQLQAH